MNSTSLVLASGLPMRWPSSVLATTVSQSVRVVLEPAAALSIVAEASSTAALTILPTFTPHPPSCQGCARAIPARYAAPDRRYRAKSRPIPWGSASAMAAPYEHLQHGAA